MEDSLVIETRIHASREAIWDALTAPEKIMHYMFGVRTRTTWEIGGSIEYFVKQDDGEVPVVKGTVLRVEPLHVLEHTLFPLGWEMEDIPQNYLKVRYDIFHPKGSPVLRITQSGYAAAAMGERRYKDTVRGWEAALPALKKLAETSGY